MSTVRRNVWPRWFLWPSAVLLIGCFGLAAAASPVAGGFDPAKQREMGRSNFRAFRSVRQRLPEAGEEVSLIAVGDLMLSRGVARKIKAQGDIHSPFLKVRDYLKGADIVFGNLESPIAAGREIGRGEMVFRA